MGRFVVSREPVLAVCRLSAAAVASIPGLGVGLLTLNEAFSRQLTLDLDQVFHLVLATSLMLLTVSLVGSILAAATAARALFLGAAGFLVSLAGALLSEVFGPPALMALVVATCLLATRPLWSSVARRVEHAHQADAQQPQDSR